MEDELGRQVAIEGASRSVCEALGIPPEWAERCEDSAHVGHDNTHDALANRLERLISTGALPKFDDKMTQLGSYGGGNHFGECEAVVVGDNVAHAAPRKSSACATTASRSCPTAVRAASAPSGSEKKSFSLLQMGQVTRAGFDMAKQDTGGASSRNSPP